MAKLHTILLTATIGLFLLVSCNPQKHAIKKANRKVERKADRRTGGVYKQYTAEQYVRRFHRVAVKKMRSNGIPASITLAQGLLESGNGNSALARYANNHFGIKCTPDWKGRKYYRDDDRKNDCFRVYKNPEASFNDHSDFLKRPRYQSLYKLKKTDYKGWAHELKKCGYATNPDYPQLLINLIERHDLHRYDRKGKRKQMKKQEASQRAVTPATKPASRTTPPPAQQPGKTYTVQAGDTLYSISTRFGMTVEELMRINGLTNTTIIPGRKLVVKQ